ncbi:MAG: hypothetical protein HFF18_11760 [Oscillospiraceae bacterium]|nr:hypothetical protein [Oscillospiraceae bacterium]
MNTGFKAETGLLREFPQEAGYVWRKGTGLEAVPLGEVCGFASQNRCWQGKKAQEYWMYFKLF